MLSGGAKVVLKVAGFSFLIGEELAPDFRLSNLSTNASKK